jgi:twitching motility protein PilT
MTTSKDISKHFRAAQWSAQAHVDAFVTMALESPELELSELLDIVCTRKLINDMGVHKARIGVFSHLVEQRGDKSLFVHLVRALRSVDPRVRPAITALIPKVNNVGRHPELCELLRLPEDSVRAAAAGILKQVAGKTVLRVLTHQCGQSDFPGRVEAMEVLVPTAGHHSLPAFAAVLEAGTPEEKIKALEYLADPRFFGKDQEGTLGVIKIAIADRVEGVAPRAIAAYAANCDEDDYFDILAPGLDDVSLSIVKASVAGLRRFRSPRAIAILERKLRQGPNAVRFVVLDTLEAIGSDEVLPPLVAALAHKQISIRARAAEVLSELSRRGAVDIARTIIWLLRSRDVQVRRMAAEIARSVKDPSGNLWPKLVGFLRDEDWWVRERVMDALIDMAGTELTRHMAGFLSDPSAVVRRFAVNVLMRLKDQRALGLLVRTAREDADWWGREKAVEAMAEMQDRRAIPYIIDLLSNCPELQLICCTALRDLQASEGAPQVAALCASEDPDIRYSALEALEVVGTHQQAVAVQPLAVDPVPRIQNMARDLLLKWNIQVGDGVETADKARSFLDQMLVAAAEGEGDDLIITPGRRPYVKRMGKVIPLAKNSLSPEQVRTVLARHLTATHVEQLEHNHDVDFSHEVTSAGLRFRVNVFKQRGGLAAVFRLVKGELPDLDKLGLPSIVRNFGDLKNGLVLVGGPTGSGKSTTLAALIDYINATSKRHIISLEDPIEVVHYRKTGLVNQREVGTHTSSYGTALRSTLRQDPDVILVGEMRDLETIAFAVSAAETGHLVYGTVHTVSSDTTMDRLVNAFPPRQQTQVRFMLAESLRAVVCQYLLKRVDQPGRIPALEIMLVNDAVSNLIRKGKTFQIPSVISTSKEEGMQLMDNELMRLYKEGIIAPEEAYLKAVNKKEFESVFEKEGDAEKVEELVSAAATGEG